MRSYGTMSLCVNPCTLFCTFRTNDTKSSIEAIRFPIFSTTELCNKRLRNFVPTCVESCVKYKSFPGCVIWWHIADSSFWSPSDEMPTISILYLLRECNYGISSIAQFNSIVLWKLPLQLWLRMHPAFNNISRFELLRCSIHLEHKGRDLFI